MKVTVMTHVRCNMDILHVITKFSGVLHWKSTALVNTSYVPIVGILWYFVLLLLRRTWRTLTITSTGSVNWSGINDKSIYLITKTEKYDRHNNNIHTGCYLPNIDENEHWFNVGAVHKMYVHNYVSYVILLILYRSIYSSKEMQNSENKILM